MNQVSVTWSDGSDQRVWSGSLKGVVHGNQLRVRFCSDGAFGNEEFVCPNYEPESDLFALRGGKLVWYKKQDSGFERYMTLKRVAARRERKKPGE
ncbi:hypothetical protein FAZ69_21120 [Trinickia terrae]|uniref:Uncharacterized protein n=1 Tax=Trinickia terrae TaxID=2571161 RepID=A0A4U1HZI2_9BURK|nr:hypothetical protein [Trinickia terrae]TKC86347.1 hypothetical protein FAZ69_21120 [Trinickia terrae]